MAQKITIIGEHKEERDVQRELGKITHSRRNNSEYSISQSSRVPCVPWIVETAIRHHRQSSDSKSLRLEGVSDVFCILKRPAERMTRMRVALMGEEWRSWENVWRALARVPVLLADRTLHVETDS